MLPSASIAGDEMIGNGQHQRCRARTPDAFEHTKEVYVVWKPARTPSPFITETATKVFSSVDDALTYFQEKGMFAAQDLFGA